MFGKKPDAPAAVSRQVADETLDNVLRAEASLKRMRMALESDLAALRKIAEADRTAPAPMSDAPAEHVPAAPSEESGAGEDADPADRAE